MSVTSKDLERKAFDEERKAYETAAFEASKSFDQAMLTLGTGALGFSMLFLNQIAHRPSPWTMVLLIVAWLGFIASIVCTLLSFLAAQYAARAGRADLDHNFNREHGAIGEQTRQADLWVRLGSRMPTWLGGPGRLWAECVDRLNVTSVASFIVGVVFLVLFSAFNLDFEGAAHVGQRVQTGNDGAGNQAPAKPTR